MLIDVLKNALEKVKNESFEGLRKFYDIRVREEMVEDVVVDYVWEAKCRACKLVMIAKDKEELVRMMIDHLTKEIGKLYNAMIHLKMICGQLEGIKVVK